MRMEDGKVGNGVDRHGLFDVEWFGLGCSLVSCEDVSLPLLEIARLIRIAAPSSLPFVILGLSRTSSIYHRSESLSTMLGNS